MSRTLKLVLISVFAAGLTLALLGRPLFLIAAIVIVLFAFFFSNVAGFRQAREESIEEQLSNEQRSLLRPITRLHQEIEELVAQNRDDPATAVIGLEALAESRQIQEHCANMIKLRSELKRHVGQRFTAERGIEQLETELAVAGEAEKPSLEKAIQARRTELQHYESQEASLARIDANLRQAEAALAEIKARLSVAATSGAGDGSDEDLMDTIARLKSLSASFEEAEEVLKENA